jgi:hypothetical protein
VLAAVETPQAMTFPMKLDRDGKKYPLVRRASLCVHVDEMPAKKGAK